MSTIKKLFYKLMSRRSEPRNQPGPLPRGLIFNIRRQEFLEVQILDMSPLGIGMISNAGFFDVGEEVVFFHKPNFEKPELSLVRTIAKINSQKIYYPPGVQNDHLKNALFRYSVVFVTPD